MIEIITYEVKMPALGKRRYQLKAKDPNGKKWLVIDTLSNNEARYTGNFQDAALARHHLNKKHYDIPPKKKLK